MDEAHSQDRKTGMLRSKQEELDLNGRAQEDLSIILQTLQLSIPVLSKHPEQINSQFTGRLIANSSPCAQDLLAQIRTTSRPWLRPLTPTMDQTGDALFQTLTGHSDDINEIAITPDGRRVITASSDNTIKLWDLKTGREISTFSGHQHNVDYLAVAMGGQRLVSVSRLHEVKIWDIHSGAEVFSMECDTGGAAATPESKIALIASGLDLLAIDVSTFETKYTLTGHEEFIEAVVMTKNGRLAASSTDEGNIIVWDLENRRKIRTFSSRGFIYDLEFTPDNRHIISLVDHWASLWDLNTGKEETRVRIEFPSKVMFTPDGKRAMFAAGNEICSWGLQKGEEMVPVHSDADLYNDIYITPDNCYLMTASSDATLRVWDMSLLGKSSSLSGHEYWNTRVMFSSNGKFGISSCDESIKVWDAATCTQIYEISDEYQLVRNTWVSPDGKDGFLIIDKGYMDLYDLESGKLLAIFRCSSDSPTESVEISPDRKMVLGVSDGTRIGKYGGANNWLFIWKLENLGTWTDPEDMPALWPVAECKIPRPMKTETFGGVEYTIGDEPIWTVRDPETEEEIGDLADYLNWAPEIVQVPGLEKEVPPERIDDFYKLEINKAQDLVISSRFSDKPGVTFSGEGRVRSYDLHPDQQTIIAADSKGKVFFLQIEGFGSLPLTTEERIGALIAQSNPLISEGRYADALLVCDRILALSPDHPAALTGRIRALYELSRFQEMVPEAMYVIENELVTGENLALVNLFLSQAWQNDEN